MCWHGVKLEEVIFKNFAYLRKAITKLGSAL